MECRWCKAYLASAKNLRGANGVRLKHETVVKRMKTEHEAEHAAWDAREQERTHWASVRLTAGLRRVGGESS